MRLLKTLQRSGNKARTQALNQLHAVVLTAPPGLRERLRDLKTRELLATCAAFRIRSDDDSLTGTTRLVLRELAQRIAMVDEQLADTTKRLQRITTALAPDLIAKHGVGPDTASTLLVVAGDNPHRLHSERSFAALLASSPIPASSGKRQNRHRLNRGGDRHGNAALWRIALVRMATDDATRKYVTKRIADGKSKPEAIRCLKRYIAREVFNALPKKALV